MRTSGSAPPCDAPPSYSPFMAPQSARSGYLASAELAEPCPEPGSVQLWTEAGSPFEIGRQKAQGAVQNAAGGHSRNEVECASDVHQQHRAGEVGGRQGLQHVGDPLARVGAATTVT